jgi:hypothetical protein
MDYGQQSRAIRVKKEEPMQQKLRHWEKIGTPELTLNPDYELD